MGIDKFPNKGIQTSMLIRPMLFPAWNRSQFHSWSGILLLEPTGQPTILLLTLKLFVYKYDQTN